MLYKDAFKTATRSLTHGKMRSILTMLGIVIGIASVIILMSIGQSAQDLILGQVESIGSNLIIIIPGAPANGKFSSPAAAKESSLPVCNKEMLMRFLANHRLIMRCRKFADKRMWFTATMM